MDSNLITLPPEWNERCCRFAVRSVAGYNGGRKNHSLYYSTFGMEKNLAGQAEAKMAECAFCLWAGLDPATALDWSDQPDNGADIIYLGYKVDVKQTKMTHRYLLWPGNKVPAFDRKNFDAFVLVKSARPQFLIARWISKKEFRQHHLVARPGVGLLVGDWYLDQAEMWFVPRKRDDPALWFCREAAA